MRLLIILLSALLLPVLYFLILFFTFEELRKKITSKIAFEILFLLIIPSLIGLLLFFYDVNIPLKEELVNDKKVITLDTDEFLRPSFKNRIRRIFQSSFDLYYYNFCFKNDSSGDKDLEFLHNEEVIKKEKLTKPEECYPLKLSDKIYYSAKRKNSLFSFPFLRFNLFDTDNTEPIQEQELKESSSLYYFSIDNHNMKLNPSWLDNFNIESNQERELDADNFRNFFLNSSSPIMELSLPIMELSFSSTPFELKFEETEIIVNKDVSLKTVNPLWEDEFMLFFIFFIAYLSIFKLIFGWSIIELVKELGIPEFINKMRKKILEL